MANYRIDELELKWISPTKYSFLATTNPDRKENNTVVGELNGLELDFKPGAFPDTERIFFKYDVIGFKECSPLDVLAIFIYDTPALRKKKGGVVIADTKYPPPIAIHEIPEYQFPTQFWITRLFAKRIGSTDEFTIKIDLDYEIINGDYTKDIFQFVSDPKNNDLDVAIFNVNQLPVPASAQSTPFPYPGGSVGQKKMELKRYPDGLPLIVAKKGDWGNINVDMKKGVIFIE